jgi:RimJ/RimL family protein N-acetyltransferase
VASPDRRGEGVVLEPWGEGDLWLLEATLADPAMTEHIGGPESPEKLVERQARFEKLADSGTGRMFKIIDEATGKPAGHVGYWDKEWRGEQVYEMGWFVLPAFQGRGIATRASELVIDMARSERKQRFMHAFPSVHNPQSNAICRKLGFTLLEELDFEYPKGNLLRCNDWRLDLSSPA